MIIISFSIMVSCTFISLLLVSVGIIYSKAGSIGSIIISVLFDGENISFEASLVMYINSTNIPPIIIMNRIYENQNLLYIVPLIRHIIVANRFIAIFTVAPIKVESDIKCELSACQISRRASKPSGLASVACASCRSRWKIFLSGFMS